MDQYGTHLPPLVAAVFNTAGPVLELGCGDFSTPILHALCRDRLLVSADADAEWLARFEDLRTKNHELHHVTDWAGWTTMDQHWDVAFIDHSPGERRRVDIERLADRATFLVVHDSEEPGYEYEPGFAKFAHRVDYRRYPTWTTLLSNFRCIDWLWSPGKETLEG